MAEELEKTCENCEYESEDMEGTHCRHCIHNAEEHFAPKINHEKEIRAKAIDEFAEQMKWEYRESIGTSEREINFACAVIEQVAERMKGGAIDG
jgi:hypothetical protein